MRKFFKKSAAVVVGSLAGVGAASAAVPADVTSALTGASADGVSVAGTVLGVIVAIVAFRYIRRAL